MKLRAGITASARCMAVIKELKCSDGLSVPDIAARLSASYMGVKQHCQMLEKNGYATSRNHHQPVGRPVLIYRLTEKGEALFHDDTCPLAISFLEHARAMFGANAPMKLLYRHFEKAGESYRQRIAAELPVDARLARLAALRTSEGCLCRIEEGDLVEHHTPWGPIFEAFPDAVALELKALSSAIAHPLRRQRVSEQSAWPVRFTLAESPTATPPSPGAPAPAMAAGRKLRPAAPTQ